MYLRGEFGLTGDPELPCTVLQSNAQETALSPPITPAAANSSVSPHRSSQLWDWVGFTLYTPSYLSSSQGLQHFNPFRLNVKFIVCPFLVCFRETKVGGGA